MGDLLDAGVIGRGVQNIIIAQINGDVANALDAGVVLPLFVGEKDTVPRLQIVGMDVFPLLDLRTGGGVQKHPCAFIKHVLHQRGTIEFLRRKALQ